MKLKLNIDCKEIQAQLKEYLQSYNRHTEYKKDILSKIQTKTEKNGWDEKRREHAILILISCNYCAAVNFIDIKFLMSHDEGRAAIKDQVFCNKYYKSEDDCFNCILKYLKRKTEKDGWSDKQKKDFISDLILNGQKRFYMIESIAFNLKNPIVQDFMKDHLNPNDEIFKKLVNHLNKGYHTDKRKYFENRIFYLISLQPEFVIDYVDPIFLLNNIEKDLIKSGLKKYGYTKVNVFNFSSIIDLALYNLDLIKKNNAYVELIIDEINGLYELVVKKCLRDFFGNDKNFCDQIFFALEDQLYSERDSTFVKIEHWRSTFLKLISSNPTRIIEWMISGKDGHRDKNAKFLIYVIDQPDVLNGIVTLCSKNENHNGIQKIFDELTKKIVRLYSDPFLNYSLDDQSDRDYSLDAEKKILRDKKNSTFLQKYLIYISQLNDIDKKNKILKLLKEWNINTEIQTESVDKNNLREKDSKNNTDVESISSNISKGNDNDTKEKIQESMENTNSAQNINPEIDLDPDILELLKEWNIDLGVQTESVDKNNLREKDSKNNTDVESISSNISKGNDNDTKEKIQESMENTNSAQNINPKIDLNKNQNNKTEEEIMYEGIVRDQKNLPKQNDKIQNQSQKIIVSDNNNSINQEQQSPPKPNLFKAKILHNPLMIAIGFIILSILFGVIGFAVGTKWLCVACAVILFVDLVFLLAWSIKKYRKKSNDIRKINVLQNDYPEETQTKENIKSEYRSNESEINTKSPTQISQDEIKGSI